MERALGWLRAATRVSSAQWRDEIQKSATVLARGVAGLLEALTEAEQREADARKKEAASESHVRAQRFATVRVAEIQLYHAAQVKAGRSAGDLYGTLRAVLDSARAAYTKEFLTPVNGVPDYLHQEIVKTLAGNDAKLLGPEYPGPLV